MVSLLSLFLRGAHANSAAPPLSHLGLVVGLERPRLRLRRRTPRDGMSELGGCPETCCLHRLRFAEVEEFPEETVDLTPRCTGTRSS